MTVIIIALPQDRITGDGDAGLKYVVEHAHYNVDKPASRVHGEFFYL